jgi:glycolate oxidase iron-sulfur subunit
MKEYGELFKDDEVLARKASEFSKKVKDLSEFLTEAGIPEISSGFNGGVTYHDACHLVHTQKIYDEPRKIINSVKGINFIPLEDSTKCCGSAGIYNLIHYDASMELLKMKIDKIDDTNAEILLTGNPGCMLQIAYGVKKFNKNVRVMHPASFFNKIILNNTD